VHPGAVPAAAVPGIAAVEPGRHGRHRPGGAGLAYNTAVSFDTNTNWQNYSGENTMTYLTQMAGLAVRNFVSAATGIAVASP
jgi:K+-transporting ATPase A subunit